MSEFFPNSAVARSLPRLPRKLCQLRGQLLDHVVDTQQVRFRAFQLQFRLMTTLVQARDTRSLFKDAAAVLWFGVDQFRNLALPNQSGRMRTGGGVREQHLNVARTYVFAVRFIGAAHIARDATHDFQLVLIVEPRRGQPVAIIDMDRHFSKISGRARGGTCEDHVFHPAAAHRGGAVFAHDPSQRFQQVGLPTPIRPDNTGQAVRDHQIGRVNKAFETCQTEL